MGHGFNGIQAALEGALCLIWTGLLPMAATTNGCRDGNIRRIGSIGSHVREEIQRQLQSGKTSQEGFGTAVQNLGTARAGVALLMSDRERKRWGMFKAPMQESSKER